jgi:hypothetical protein
LKLFGKGETADQKITAKGNFEHVNLDYHPKIIVAWIKCIEGEAQFGKYLHDNGFEELFHTQQALILNNQSREWLMSNGFPHLLAFVNSSEGNGNAKQWLRLQGFDLLLNMAKAIDDEPEGFVFLKQYSNSLIFDLTKVIKKVKDQIEFNHNDMYSFGKDQ